MSVEIKGFLPYLKYLSNHNPKVLRALGVRDGFYLHLGVKKGLFELLAKTPIVLARDLVGEGSYSGDLEVKRYNVKGQSVNGVALCYGNDVTALIQEEAHGKSHNLRLTHYRRFGNDGEDSEEAQNGRLVEIAQSTVLLARRAYQRWHVEIPNKNSKINDGQSFVYDPKAKA